MSQPCKSSRYKKRKKKTEQQAPQGKCLTLKQNCWEAFIRALSSEIGESWQGVGVRLGFSQSQMDQLKHSYTDDSNFCTQVMLREWHLIAKDFMKQPASQICTILREIGMGSLAESLARQSKIEFVKEESYDHKNMLHALHTISFGPAAVPKKACPAVHISNCQTVIVGDYNRITGTVEHQEETEPLSHESGIIRCLEMIVETYSSASQGINLQKLQTEFTKVQKGKGNKDMFYKIAGKKLLKFLQDHSHKFEVIPRGSNWYVKTISDKVLPKFGPLLSATPQRTEKMQESTHDFHVDGLEVKRSIDTPELIQTRPVVKSYAEAVSSRTTMVTSTKDYKQKPMNSPHRSIDYSSITCGVHTDPRDLLEFVNDFSRGHFILFVCLKEKTKNLDCLALVPWLAVFDFDQESRDVGLLSILEERIKKLRALYTCTWKDPARFSDFCTEWCMTRGSVQEADSFTPSDCKQWFRIVRPKLEEHFEKLAAFTETYTTVKCILLLPDDIEVLQCMQKTISKLEEYLDPAPTLIVCDTQPPYPTSWLYQVLDISFTLRCDIQTFCKSITKTAFSDNLKKAKIKYRLPTSDETNDPGFEESFVSVLRENLEVLYLDYPRNRAVDLDTLKEEGDKFLKGGTLPWFAFYECDAGHFDAERDIMESIVKRVKETFIEPFKSGILKLYHAPGSGGTTLMQRVLWELRKTSPCAQVKMHPTISVSDLAHNVESLFERTHLPLVLLMDGGEDQLTKQLMKLLDHVIVVILHVKRYPHPINGDSKHPGNRFFLKGTVSEKEAKKLGVKFLEKCCDDDKIDALNALVDDVQFGHTHSVYEFGLATFLEEYRGIASYVRGYLLLDSNTSKHLEKWQEILGFLSLAYYYGQTSMPCQFFATMLGKPLNYDVSFCDFPHFVKALVVPCESEGRKNNIRICHYIIAKEILDQILTWPQEYSESEARTGLSVQARSKLVHFSHKFIEESKKKTRKQDRSNTVIETLARTFLYRDYKDVGEGEISVRKKLLSRILEDIPCKPPYTERIQVIEKLVNTFPENPNFRAHLGRIYTICKPDEVEVAENCFNKALELCQKQTKGKRIDDIEESVKRILMHIYHMFGMHYLRRIDKYTGRLGETPKVKTTRKMYQERIKYILEMADVACKHFTKRREITPLGSEEGYGYIGEITVRLQVCGFISKFFPKDVSNFGEYLMKEGETSPGNFVKESIMTIVELFMECYSAVDAGELDQDYYRNINMYNALFNNQVPVLNYIAKAEDVSTRCFKAAAIKLKYGKDDNLGVLEMITNRVDIEDIVKMCEESFEEIQNTGVSERRRVLELMYKDWIQAIRHNLFPQNYSQDNVLLKIRQWNSLLQSPMSKFYLFCLLSIIGIGTDGTNRNFDHLQEAAEVKEELQCLRMYFPKPRLPREWLGKGTGIKALIPGSGFYGTIEERVVKGEGNTSRLAILKGTICRPNKQRQTGYIDLDLGENFHTIKVFFIPVRTEEKLIGKTYAGERVEFALAFTTLNGYEAYNVRLLRKVLCLSCESYVEIRSDQTFTICRTCNITLQPDIP